MLALAGCARMEPAPQPVAKLEPAHLGLADAKTAWPASQWWQRYGDLQLDRLVDAALANNPSLTAAQANAAVAGARAAHAARGRQLHADPRAYVGQLRPPGPLGRIGGLRQPASAGLQL